MAIRVYLDTNIIARIKEGKLSTDLISKKLGTDKIEYFYSDEHIRETQAIKYYAPSKEDGIKWVNQQLRVISQICDNNYLTFDLKGNIVTFKKLPLLRFLQIKDYATEEMIKSGFQDNMPNEIRKIYRQIFDFSPQELTNIAPNKILDLLDKKFIERQSKASEDYQKKWGNKLKDLEQNYFQQMGGVVNNYEKLAGIFLLLDLCGYWKDAETEKSDFARMYDSSHANWATYSDYFISNDKKTRMKTEVGYHYLNTCYNADIKTQVIELNP